MKNPSRSYCSRSAAVSSNEGWMACMVGERLYRSPHLSRQIPVWPQAVARVVAGGGIIDHRSPLAERDRASAAVAERRDEHLPVPRRTEIAADRVNDRVTGGEDAAVLGRTPGVPRMGVEVSRLHAPEPFVMVL